MIDTRTQFFDARSRLRLLKAFFLRQKAKLYRARRLYGREFFESFIFHLRNFKFTCCVRSFKIKRIIARIIFSDSASLNINQTVPQEPLKKVCIWITRYVLKKYSSMCSHWSL